MRALSIVVIALAFLSLFAPIHAEIKSPYRLVIGFDGISHGVIQELHEGGYFRNFERPVPLIATFPSISDPNWSLIIGAEPEESYTKAHFKMEPQPDGSLGQEVGTVINHLTTPPLYEKKFDFKPVGVFQHLMTVTWSQTSALYWIESIQKILLDPKNLKGSMFSALIINTDIISHVSGKMALMEYLKKVDAKFKQLQIDFKKEYNRDLEIIFVSDHGAYYTTPKSIDFQKPLLAAGWDWKKSLRKDTDYAFVAPEIISFAAFYTKPKKECDFALLMSQVVGVHVALCSPSKDTILFYSKVGRTEAKFDIKNKTVSYRLISGRDPFEQIDFFQKNKKLSWDKYFQKSMNLTYPNALVRAWEGFHLVVKNPASVLVSPEKGYVFTNLTLEILTALSGIKSTHGSFEKEESYGFVMSTSQKKEEVFTPSLFYQTYIKN